MTPTYVWAHSPKKVGVLYSQKNFLMIEEVAYRTQKKYDAERFANGKYTDPALKGTIQDCSILMVIQITIRTGRDELPGPAFTQNSPTVPLRTETRTAVYGAFV